MGRRCFFALWPPPSAREALARLAREIAAQHGGRAVPAAKIHLTLAFLGDLGDAHVEGVMAQAARIREAPVNFVLDRIGSLARGRLAWAGAHRPPQEVANLASGVRAAAARSGLAIERRPFLLHVTLVRDCASPVAAAPIDPVAWTSSAFALVESDLREGRYAERGSWRLGEETR